MSKPREVHCYDYVNRPYDTVRGALEEDAVAVFRAATKAASSRAESVASELRVNVGALEVAAEISIEVKEIAEEPRTTTSPPTTRLTIEWAATKNPRLFPFMRATLSLYPLTATETQLEFDGRYDPPMGALGNALDAAVGYRIAEASVHRFLKDVADHLRRSLD